MKAFWVVVAMVTGALAMVPVEVRACQCTADPIYHSQPSNNARAVPLDIAPVIEGPFDPSTITFEDERGTAVEFELEQGPKGFCIGGFAELLPKQLLAANTRYTIRVAGMVEGLPDNERFETVTFTTGDSEIPDEALAAPSFSAASVLRGARDCGGLPTNMTCIGGLAEPAADDLELLLLRDGKTLLRINYLVQNGAYAISEAADCIELRRRSGDGRRSSPTRVCGDALLVRDIVDSDQDEFGSVSCKDGILGDRAAYESLADAGAADAGEADAGAPDAGATDAGTQPAENKASDAGAQSSGCNAVTSAHNDLLTGLLIALGCALFSAVLRRLPNG